MKDTIISRANTFFASFAFVFLWTYSQVWAQEPIYAKVWIDEDNNPVLLCGRGEDCECTGTASAPSPVIIPLSGGSGSGVTPSVCPAGGCSAGGPSGGTAVGGGTVDNSCTWILIGTGNPSVGSTLPSGFFRLWAERPISSLYSPEGLRYVLGGYGMNSISKEKTAGGVPQQISVVNPDGLKVIFRFADNESIGKPWGSTETEDSTRVLMTDAQGWAVTSDPAYYDLYTGGGDLYRFVAATNSSDYLQLSLYKNVRGRTETASSWVADVIRDNANILRQVKSVTSLADIIVANEHKYSINFYKISDVQAQKDTNGYYVVTSNAGPLTVWTIENPETNTLKKLRVSKASGTKTNVYDYVYSAEADEWQLTSGGGLRVKASDQVWNEARTYMVNTVVERDAAANLLSKTATKYYVFPWKPERVEKVIDPDGEALKTEYAYYENASESHRYSKLKSMKNPDGSWMVRDYNANGYKSVEITPWKDSPFNSASNNARAIYYDYTPVAAGDSLVFNDQRPRTVTEKILGVTASKTYYAYVTNAVGELSEIVEHCVSTNALYGDSSSLRSVTTYYGTNVAAFKMTLPKTVEGSDGRLDTYDYQYGTFHASNSSPKDSWFEVDANGADLLRTIVHGTTNSPDGVAYKTSKNTTIFDQYGRGRREEAWVYTGGANYERVAWTMPEYDDYFHMTKLHKSDGTIEEASWGSNCCGKESDKDASGIERTYEYDLLDRLIATTKKGTNSPIGDVKSESTLDAAGRALTTKISGGSLSIVTSSNTYNKADQLVASVDSLGLTTTYAQTGGGLTNIVTSPGGLTNVSVSYLDGNTKYVKENDVVQTWSDHGVNADGTQWAITYTGPAGTNSPVWSKTTTDFLGRTILAEQPGFGGVIVTNSNVYNSRSQLVRTQASGFSPQPPATIYEYNDLGEQFRSGLDVDNDDVLDLAGSDRVNENETYYEQDASNAWWQVSASKLYATAGSSAVTTNSIQKTRLTGLGITTDNGLLTTDSRSIDIFGNLTTSAGAINRNAKTVTQTTVYPDSAVPAVSITVNGLLRQTVSKTGLTNGFAYDALERQIGVTDPRTGTSLTHYNDKGQVDYVEDAAANRTSFSYDQATGRRTAVTDALSNTVYTAYDVEGQQVATWGATYPVIYELLRAELKLSCFAALPL